MPDEMRLTAATGIGPFGIGAVVGVVQAAFDIRIAEFWDSTVEFCESITVGELIDLVEGQIRAGGIS